MLALPDIEVNGIDDSNNMAAAWWAHVQAFDWLTFLFGCSVIIVKLVLTVREAFRIHVRSIIQVQHPAK